MFRGRLQKNRLHGTWQPICLPVVTTLTTAPRSIDWENSARMKWFKRLLVLLIVIALGGAVFLGTSYYLSKRKPKWYKPLAMDSREMDAAANRAINKVIALHNIADQAAARDSSKQWRQDHGATTLPAVQPISVSFTQDELTAFITRWSSLNSDRVEKYVTGPQFVLDEGQIKFACRITELDQIGVIRLEPGIDDKGRLSLDILSISAGSLPVPEAFVQKPISKVQTMLKSWLPAWQQSARLGADGANSEAVKAAMSKLLLNTLHHDPASPVLFMPIDSHKTVPVKLTHVVVGKGTITFTVQPLTAEERADALQAIREPYDTATAINN